MNTVHLVPCSANQFLDQPTPWVVTDYKISDSSSKKGGDSSCSFIPSWMWYIKSAIWEEGTYTEFLSRYHSEREALCGGGKLVGSEAQIFGSKDKSIFLYPPPPNKKKSKQKWWKARAFYD